MFELHPQLAKDTMTLGDFELSKVLLMNDARYPWIILVPKRAEIKELYQLSVAEQQQFIAESSFVAEQMMQLFQADKMNIAALGNMVPQLHIHHVARFANDSCWPKPIWGIGESQPYLDEELELITPQLKSVLQAYFS